MTQVIKIIFFFFISFTQVFAIEDTIVNIISLSKSGKTIYVDRGKNDKIGSEDFGILLTREEIELNKVIFRPIAKLRAVKVMDQKSVWIVYKEFIPNMISLNKRFLLFSESAFLKGRTELKIDSNTLVTIDNPAKEVKEYLVEGEELSKKNDEYQALAINHKKERHYNSDYELLNVGKWDNKLEEDKYYIDGIYRSPRAKEFSERRRVQTFEKMVVAFLEKYNDPLFHRESFFKEQEKSSSGLPLNPVYKSASKKVKVSNQYKAAQEEKLYKNLREKGDAWSDSYSDNELANLLTNMNIVRERKRRKNLMTYKFDYQAHLAFGLNLVNNENLNDPETTEQSKYDIELAVESYILKNYQSLKDFSLEGSVRRAKDSYYGGVLNVRSTEYSLAGQLNWYPFLEPAVINENIYYVGIYTRYGIARLNNISTNEEGNYQVFTLPGFKIGLKYNFDNLFGFKMSFGYGSIRSERITRNADDGTLPNRARYTEGKLSLALTRFF